MKSFGENLQELMDHHRISVRELAKELEVSPRTVQEWVGSGGRTPRDLVAVRRLAARFGCTIHFLLYGEEEPKIAQGILLEGPVEIHAGVYEITIRKVLGR